MQISWSIEGEKQLSRNLGFLVSSIKDWTPAFKQAGDDLVRVFSTDVFNTQGRAVGESWQPLKPGYAAQKARRGYPTTPLVTTGQMQRSFQSLYKADFAAVWNNAFYFKYHQSNKPRKRLPRRVMMKLGENQRQMVVKIFHTYWHKKVNRG